MIAQQDNCTIHSSIRRKTYTVWLAINNKMPLNDMSKHETKYQMKKNQMNRFNTRNFYKKTRLQTETNYIHQILAVS